MCHQSFVLFIQEGPPTKRGGRPIQRDMPTGSCDELYISRMGMKSGEATRVNVHLIPIKKFSSPQSCDDSNQFVLLPSVAKAFEKGMHFHFKLKNLNLAFSQVSTVTGKQSDSVSKIWCGLSLVKSRRNLRTSREF